MIVDSALFLFLIIVVAEILNFRTRHPKLASIKMLIANTPCLYLEKQLRQLMHLNQHEVRVELGVLLAGKFQIKSTIVNFSETNSLSLVTTPCWHTTPKQLVFTVFGHLKQLSELLQEVAMVKAISHELILSEVTLLRLLSD